jgi:serine/threonine-protein kinase
MPKALAAGARALAADPDLPDAQAVMTNLRAINDGYQAGGESLRRLAERHPSCFWAQRYLGLWLMHTGDQRAAIEVLRRAQVIEPLAVHNSGNIGMALYFDSRFADAIDQLEITLRMDPAFGFARMFLGRSRLLLGQADRAIDEFERMPSTTMAPRVEVAVAWALSERTDSARAVLAELKQMSAARAFEVATLHAALGDQDEALTWLERAIDQGSFGFFVDPLFHALRDTPRFRALTARIRLSA